jgi:hypothetical protein
MISDVQFSTKSYAQQCAESLSEPSEEWLSVLSFRGAYVKAIVAVAKGYQAAALRPRMLCGVPVDELGQPLRAWSESDSEEFVKGASDAYHGLSMRRMKRSAEYNRGRAAQISFLPKRQTRSGRAVDWSRCLVRSGGSGWVMGQW